LTPVGNLRARAAFVAPFASGYCGATDRQSHNALVAAIICVAWMGASYFIGLALNRGRLGIRHLLILMTLAAVTAAVIRGGVSWRPT
jgi:hypothetical protein